MLKTINEILFGKRKKIKELEEACSTDKIFESILPDDMEGLLKRYKMEQALLSYVANEKMGKLDEEDLKRLRVIERKIIGLLPNELDRQVLEIVSRYNFNIEEFLDENDWKSSFEKKWFEICHFMYYGSPFPQIAMLWEPLPFPGNEFIFWLFKKAITGESDDLLDNVNVEMVKMVKSKKIYGRTFGDQEIQSLGMRVIVIFAGEFNKHANILIDIMREVENGEEVVKEILDIKNNEEDL
jgi:hypothetical protein